MSMQPADIDEDDDDIIDDHDEDLLEKTEQRGAPHGSTTQIVSKDPIIINR